MKLHLLDRASHDTNSIMVNRRKKSSFLRVWHYHPELELVLILKSKGTRFVGDSIEKFEPGQLVLLGPEIPHMWINDREYYEENISRKVDAVAIHFQIDFLGKDLFSIYEFSRIRKLLLDSKRGVLFKNVDKNFQDKMLSLLDKSGVDRIIQFLMILDELSKAKEIKYLASKGYTESFNRTGINNLDKVYSFIFNNFHQRITLKKIAGIANMNPAAFSRFFKKNHHKTFIRYLNEIRIGYACKMLIEGPHTISSISYECGFNNLSNFNRQFKLIKGMSPSKFADKYKV